MNTYQHRPVRAGALTLLITTVLLCMAVLAVLSLSTARADEALADKNLQTLQLNAEAERVGQEWLAQLDAACRTSADLPEQAVRQEDGTVTAQLALSGTNTLRLVLRVEDGSYTILRWQVLSEWDPTQTLTVWDGE